MTTNREMLEAMASRSAEERLLFLEETVIRLSQAVASLTGAFQAGIDAADGAMTGELFADEVRGD